MRSSKQAVAVVLVAVLAVMSMPAMAATNTAVASENTNETDFNNATTLDGFTVEGSGESAYIGYSPSSVTVYDWQTDHRGNGITEVGGGHTYDSTNNRIGVSPGDMGDWTQNLEFRDDLDGTNQIDTWMKVQGDFVGLQGLSSKQEYPSRTDADESITIHLRAPDDEISIEHGSIGGSNTTSISGLSGTTKYWMHISVSGDTYTLELHSPDGDGDPGSSLGTVSHTTTSVDTTYWAFASHMASSVDAYQYQWGYDPTPTDTATYVGQSHTVDGAQMGKVNITTNSEATTYVEWQYHDGSSWQTHTNQSYTTAGVKSTDLSTQSATQWRSRVHVTDPDTNGAVDVQGEWVEFENTAPVVDNTSATPTGTLDSGSTTVSIDVSDPDFATTQSDELNASLYVDGSYAGSDTLTSNGTASVDATISAESTYHWDVSDDYGGSTTSDAFTVTAPAELYVFNETSPHNLVDNVNVNVTVTGAAETVDLEMVSDGTVTLAGLPTGQAYVFTITAPGYHPREVYVDDLFEQQSVYLLSEDRSSVQNRLTITDRTGEYDQGTVILVDRVVNTTEIEQTPDNGPQWITMGGDRLGTSGFYAIDLQTDSRYRFRAINDQGDSRVLGEYTAKSGGTVDLQIGSIQYAAGDGENSYQWDVSHTNVTDSNHSVTFAYNDHENITNNVSVEIVTRENGTLISSHDFTDGEYGEAVYTAQINNSTWQNKTLAVEWSASRNGTVISGERLVSGKATQDFPISGVWKTVAYAAGVLVLAFLIGAGAGPAPAIITVALFSGFGVYIGLAPPELGFGSTMVVMMMGAIYKLRETQSV